MTLDIVKQYDLFESYANGDNEKLKEILNLEKAMLFDYSLRMTGDINFSENVIKNVLVKMEKSSSKWEDLSSFRIATYKLVRSYDQKSWNADVSKLEHPSLLTMIKNPEVSSNQKQRALAFNKLNQTISSCSGPAREIIILHIRSKFTFSDINKIIGSTREEIERSFLESIRYLKKSVPSLPNNPRKAVSSLLVYPFPEKEKAEAVPISGMIRNFNKPKEKDTNSASFYIVLAIFFLIIGVIIYLLLFKPRVLRFSFF